MKLRCSIHQYCVSYRMHVDMKFEFESIILICISSITGLDRIIGLEKLLNMHGKSWCKLIINMFFYCLEVDRQF